MRSGQTRSETKSENCMCHDLLAFNVGILTPNRSSSNAHLLATAYTNSPVNTSPPFAPSRDQVALQTNTHAKAEELIDAAGRLQKVCIVCQMPPRRVTYCDDSQETELSSRDKRKLGSFVEKWIQSRN